MAYRVTAVTGLGAAAGVIVPSAKAALAKVKDYEAFGHREIVVQDLDGNVVAIDDLRAAVRSAPN